MKSEDLDGKSIDQVMFPSGEVLSVKEDTYLQYKYEYHGEYDDAWVVQTKADGKEIARHNVKFIESIIWSES